MKALFDLSGMGVCITGGAGYLGSAVVGGLLGAEATVLVCDTNEQALARLGADMQNKEGHLMLRHIDINNPAQREGLLDELEAEAGSIAGWINNAYAGCGGLLGEATREQLEGTVVNGLVRVMEITQDVANRMISNRRGSIINICSMYGIVSPQPDAYVNHPQFHNPPAYGAAKAGLIQYTRYAACHLAKHGIRVNAVSPGAFPNDKARAEDGFEEELTNRIPLGRVGRPEDLVGAIIYLLSNASGYVTGHNLVVDGGWTVW